MSVMSLSLTPGIGGGGGPPDPGIGGGRGGPNAWKFK